MELKIHIQKFKNKHHQRNLAAPFLADFKKFLKADILSLTTISPHTLEGKIGTYYDEEKYLGKLSAVKNRYYFEGKFLDGKFEEPIRFQFEIKRGKIKPVKRPFIITVKEQEQRREKDKFIEKVIKEVKSGNENKILCQYCNGLLDIVALDSPRGRFANYIVCRKGCLRVHINSSGAFK